MKKHEKVDAIFDIATIGVLVFTVMIVVNDPVIKFALVLLGCGAMYNNVKYAMKKKKKVNKKKKEKAAKEIKEIKEKMSKEKNK